VDQPRFYFDLASPDAWLVAERVLRELPVLAEWTPAALGAQPDPDWDDVAARARAAGALPLRPPAAWPPDPAFALHAATFAKQLGKTVAFVQAVFRQAFTGGRDLGAPETALIAGAAAEMHPRAVLRAVGLAGVRRDLTQRTAEAREHGIGTGPALVLLDGSVHEGPGCLESAAGALSR
jgi:2-hydroxychromene-2-carboxylate isomerase